MSILTLNQKLGKPECPYMQRHVLKLPFGYSLRYHKWARSDDKRAMHDHPWWFITLVLTGAYEDWTEGPICRSCNGTGKIYLRRVEYHDFNICGRCEGRGFELAIEKMRPGNISYRPALHTHTVSVAPGGCRTILLMGPQRRKWGFWARKPSGKWKWFKANKWFFENGHHQCDQT